jgi:hypothetical protein
MTLPNYARVLKTDYDRSKLTVGIMHSGVRNFRRSSQTMYVDRLMRQELAIKNALPLAGAQLILNTVLLAIILIAVEAVENVRRQRLFGKR